MQIGSESTRFPTPGYRPLRLCTFQYSAYQMFAYLASIVVFLLGCSARPSYNSLPFSAFDTRQVTAGGAGLQVDLGYAVYEGYNNVTTGLNVWRG